MAGAEVLVFLLVAVALLAGFALRHDVPYPIVLVLGGLGLGFVPWLPAPELEPDVIFFVFLPPLLYAAAFQASAYELRANAGPIALLAVGLVLVTVVAVAVVAHHLIGLSVGVGVRARGRSSGRPTRWPPPRCWRGSARPARIRTILEGESLVNDGTGLTAYSLAIAAIGATVTAGDVALRLRAQGGRRHRHRARRRLGLRAPARDDARAVDRPRALDPHPVRRLRAGGEDRRLGRAGGGDRRRRDRHALAGARRRERAAAHARLLAVGRLSAQLAAVPADRAPARRPRRRRGRQGAGRDRVGGPGDRRGRARRAPRMDVRRARDRAPADRPAGADRPARAARAGLERDARRASRSPPRSPSPRTWTSESW